MEAWHKLKTKVADPCGSVTLVLCSVFYASFLMKRIPQHPTRTPLTKIRMLIAIGRRAGEMETVWIPRQMFMNNSKSRQLAAVNATRANIRPVTPKTTWTVTIAAVLIFFNIFLSPLNYVFLFPNRVLVLLYANWRISISDGHMKRKSSPRTNLGE